MSKNVSKVLVALLAAGLLTSMAGCTDEIGSTSVTSSTISSETGGSQSETTSQPDASQDSTASNSSTTSGTSTTTTKRITTTTLSAPQKIDLKGRTINFAAWWTEPERGSDATANAYWAAKDYVESTYNCKLKYHVYSTLPDYTSLIASILAGNPSSDFVNIGQEKVFSYVKRKLLTPLSDLKSMDVKNTAKWNALTTSYCTINGKVYGCNINTPNFRNLLVYNANKINGANDLYTLQTKGQLTWQKLLDIAKANTNEDAGTYGISGSMDLNYFTTALISANGGKMATRGKGLDFTYSLDSRNTRNALTWAYNFYSAGAILPTSGQSYLYAQGQFVAGKLAMIICDSWQFATIYKGAKFKVGMALMPAGPDATTPLVDQSIQTPYVITATTKKPDDVALVLNAFTTYQLSKTPKWQDKWGDIVNSTNTMNVLKQYAEMSFSDKAYVDYGSAIIGNIYDTGVYDYYCKVTKGTITAQSFLDSMSSEYKAAVVDYNK